MDAVRRHQPNPLGNNRMLPLLMNTGHIENLLNNLAQSLQHAINHREPVQRGLTKEQISKIPEVKWNSSMKAKNQTFESCPICYVDYEPSENIKKLSCNHGYHINCLSVWLEKKSECPVCKEQIKP